jgi:hypothetical protein
MCYLDFMERAKWLILPAFAVSFLGCTQEKGATDTANLQSATHDVVPEDEARPRSSSFSYVRGQGAYGNIPQAKKVETKKPKAPAPTPAEPRPPTNPAPPVQEPPMDLVVPDPVEVPSDPSEADWGIEGGEGEPGLNMDPELSDPLIEDDIQES